MNRFLWGAGGAGLAAVAFVALKLLTTTSQGDFCVTPKHQCIVVSVDATPKIVPNTDPLGKTGSGHLIHWIVSDDASSQKFTFTGQGIAFKETNNPFKCHPTTDAHVFECTDDGTSGQWHYKITLTNGSSNLASPDPIIINN